MLRIVTAVLVVAVTLSVMAEEKYKPYEDDTCLSCMCKALGGGKCESTGRCTPLPCYGPFHITEPYWVHGASPVQPGDNKLLPGAFKRCVEEPFCAVQTVRNHMSLGGINDFDRDGHVTCIDMLIAHSYGRHYNQIPDLTTGPFPYLMKCLRWNETSSGRGHAGTPSTPTPYFDDRRPSNRNTTWRSGGDGTSRPNSMAEPGGESPLQSHPIRPSRDDSGFRRQEAHYHSRTYESVNHGMSSEHKNNQRPRDHFNSLVAD